MQTLKSTVEANKYGWALRWPNGATSFMPDEQTARLHAAAPDLLAALEYVKTYITLSKGTTRPVPIEISHVVDGAIASTRIP